MDSLSFRLNRGDTINTKRVKKSAEPVKDPVIGVYLEGHFNEMLAHERKRAERSRRPFMLMLLDIADLPSGYNGNNPRKRVVLSLSLSTRETDIMGWYSEDHILGVLFTELGESDSEAAVGKILDRVYENLSANLDHEQVRDIDISIHFFPEEFDKPNLRYSFDLRLYPDLETRNSRRRIALAVKRAIDIAGSLFALLFFSPLFLVIATIIKCGSKGPVLFRQIRVGQFGKPFMMLKFRSMFIDNSPEIHQEYIKNFIASGDQIGNACGQARDQVFKIQHDPRVTPFGRFLRKSSLDELPQFFNVLKGEMSLVGPRPPIPYEVECYDTWHRNRLLDMMPGITGLWQVTARSQTTFNEVVRLDIRYAQKWSLWLDIKLLLLTPWAVLTSKGAH